VTGFMGYDPEHLGWLRDAMVRTVDDLATIRCTDPSAADAIAVVRRAQSALSERWLPFLERIRGCVVMEAYTPVRVPRDDLRLAGFTALEDSGWRFLTDQVPAHGEPAMTERQARAIATALMEGDIGDLLDDEEEIAWLARSLDAIGRDPALAGAFVGIMPRSSQRWAAICDVLAHRHLHRTDRASEEAALAAAGRLLDLPVLGTMEPYAAALVLVRLDLDDHTLASAAYSITKRWWIGPSPGTLWYDQPKGQEATADVLFAHLATRPAAATDYLWFAATHPPILFTTAADQTHTEELIRVGLDPAHVDATRAGEIVAPMLDWFVGGVGNAGDPAPFGPSLHQLAATMSVPWLAFFASRAHEWGWTYDDGERALREIVTDSAAVDRIRAGLGTWIDAALATGMPGDHDAFRSGLDALASSVSQLLWVFRDEAIRDAADMRWFVDVGVFIADHVRGLLKIHPLVNVAIDAGQPYLLEQFEEWGIIPEDMDDVRSQEDALRRGELLVLPVALVTAMTRDLVAAGLVPDDALDALELDLADTDCPEREVHDRLKAFVADLPADAETRDAMWMAVHAFLNASSVDEACRR
jgi:hypothetical protein